MRHAGSRWIAAKLALLLAVGLGLGCDGAETRDDAPLSPSELKARLDAQIQRKSTEDKDLDRLWLLEAQGIPTLDPDAYPHLRLAIQNARRFHEQQSGRWASDPTKYARP